MTKKTRQGVRNLDALFGNKRTKTPRYNPVKGCSWCGRSHRRASEYCSKQCDDKDFTDYVQKKMAGELD